MKKIIEILVLLLLNLFLTTSIDAQQLVEGDTHALIVGVSAYESKGIPSLDFAHRDAEVFKEYLQSSSGGNVPEKNIKLLTNSDATISGINGGIDWLKDNVGEKDLVYIYFSGHGDVSNGLHKVGYLLAHDSPERNFPMNSVRIDYINFLANNLSVDLGVQVVIILDACHAGKVSGSENVRSLSLGEALVTKIEEKEVRISSCRPTERSQEDVAWGNGRGAFSFYLIKGLQGLADADGDNFVTLGELDKYLSKAVKRDVNRIKRKDQNPVLKGQETSKLAIIHVPVSASVAMEEGDATLATIDGDKSVFFEVASVDPSKEYFDVFDGNITLKRSIVFNDWVDLSPDEIYDAMLLKHPIEDAEWNRKLESDIRYKNTFKRDLAIEIHDEVQRALNAYLAGDQEELERRRIYNAIDSDFGEYVCMLDVAMKLVSENSILHEIMQMKRHYFAGLDLRLQAARSEQRDSLIREAMVHQEKALALDDKAAYVHNEIGILFNYKDELEKGLDKFEEASAIAPDWPVPYGNMSNYYYKKEEYAKSFELANKATELQNDFINGYVVRGLTSIKFSDYLMAEVDLLKATNFNAQSYRGFDGLGEVYLNTFRYQESNRNFEIADSIKRRLKLSGVLDLSDEDGDGVVDLFDEEPVVWPEMCDFDVDQFGKNDIMAYFAYAYEHWRRDSLGIAEIYFKKVVEIDQEDPLANHYLGQLNYKKENYLAASHYFELADDYYLDKGDFEDHTKRLLKSQEYLECGLDTFYTMAYYDEIDIDFFLADSYRALGHYGAAEDVYRDVVNSDVKINPYIPYNKIWNLYIERSLYEVAETVIDEYAKIDYERAMSEMYKMYDDAGSRYTQYKAGVLAYNRYKVENGEFENRFTDEDGDNIIKFNADEEDKDYAIVPGRNEYLFFAPEKFWTGAALENFKVSVEGRTTIFFDSLKIGSIYAKMGELSDALHNTDDALAYCTKAMEFNKNDATPALNLIGKQIDRKDFIIAYDLLKGLYNRNQVDYRNLILLSRGEVLRSNYTMSDTIHNELMDVYPMDYEGAIYFRTLRYTLSEDYKQALNFAKMMSNSDLDNQNYYYTLCRLQAKLGDLTKSQEYLKKALDFGFDYYWVLVNDPLIDSLRNTNLYISTIENLHPFPEEIEVMNR